MNKVVAVTQFRNFVLIFMEDGMIYKMVWADSLTSEFTFYAIGHVPYQ